MNETVGVSRAGFKNIIRGLIRRIRNDDGQEVLSQAILLDVALEADNASVVLGLSESAVRQAGEGLRASYRAYQRGDPSDAADRAIAILSALRGDGGIDEPASSATTLSLVRARAPIVREFPETDDRAIR